MWRKKKGCILSELSSCPGASFYISFLSSFSWLAVRPLYCSPAQPLKSNKKEREGSGTLNSSTDLFEREFKVIIKTNLSLWMYLKVQTLFLKHSCIQFCIFLSIILCSKAGFLGWYWFIYCASVRQYNPFFSFWFEKKYGHLIYTFSLKKKV